MSYATISVFGQPKKLYRETLMKYVVSSQERPQNFPIYSVHSDVDSFILYNAKTNLEDTPNDVAVEPKETIKEKLTVHIQEILDDKENLDALAKKHSTTSDESYEHETLWHLEFDGSVNKLGAGVGVWIYNLENYHVEGHAYRLNFKCTNNMAEYEALLLGLKLVNGLGAIRVSIMGDSKLIVKKIKGVYITRDPRLVFYRGTVVEIINTFLETNLATIPRKHNMQDHNLAMLSSTCKLPFQPNHQYTIEVRHRPAILDYLMNWQVFENDKKINHFLTLDEEFASINIDVDIVSYFDHTNELDINRLEENSINMLHPTKFIKIDIRDLKQMDIDEIIDDETEVINIKDNQLPKGLIPLEDLFDSNDIPKKPKMEPLKKDIEERTIRTEENPKLKKLSKSLPPDEKLIYIELMKEFRDVFSWSYEDLKSYDTSIIQHTIPLKQDQKTFRKKLRIINHVLLPSIEKEMKRTYEAGIIAPIRFPDWVSNLVPTRKNTGEIRLCVDLRNVNKVSLKYNYPLPKMDNILQSVVGSTRISLLDGFSGYHEILAHSDD